jgi:hypothetical protein
VVGFHDLLKCLGIAKQAGFLGHHILFGVRVLDAANFKYGRRPLRKWGLAPEKRKFLIHVNRPHYPGEISTTTTTQ